MIELVNVSKTFHKSQQNLLAIDDVSMTIKDREIFSIIGPSGAGKSTLLRCINGLEMPDTGKVLVDGVDLSQLNRREMRDLKHSMGMIFQSPNLLSNLTALENVQIHQKLFKAPTPMTGEEALAFVGLSDKANSYPSQLSGGQKQRVGIARAIVTRPKIVLADESTSALDEVTAGEILDLLLKANREFGMTLVVVSHDLNLVKAISHRVALMEAGRLIQIFDRPLLTWVKDPRTYRERVIEVLSHDV